MREMVSTQTSDNDQLHLRSKPKYMEISFVYILENWLITVTVTLTPTRTQVELYK